MCKKLGVTVLVVVAALFVLHRLDLLGYIKTYMARTKEKVNDSIPAEVKLDRIERAITDLNEPINDQRRIVAREMSEIDKLDRDIASTKADLKNREKELALLRENLKSAKGDLVSFGDKQIAKSKVEASFARQYSEFEDAGAALKAKEDLRASRQEWVDQATHQLATMRSKQAQMRTRVQKLKLELARVREAQIKHDVTDCDSQFADVLKRIDDVEIQVGTDGKLAEFKAHEDDDVTIQKSVKDQLQNEDALKKWDANHGDKVSQK